LEIDERLAFLLHSCSLLLDGLSVFLGGFPLPGSGMRFLEMDRQDEIFTLGLSDATTVHGTRFAVQAQAQAQAHLQLLLLTSLKVCNVRCQRVHLCLYLIPLNNLRFKRLRAHVRFGP
jgi:hypothetical protein